MNKMNSWVINDNDNCSISEKEMERALFDAKKDILKGAKPVPPKTTPHMILTIGPPGAGKSTIASEIAKLSTDKGSPPYLIIDYDLAVKYHPRYKGSWGLLDATTEKKCTHTSLSTGFLVCNGEIEHILTDLFRILVNAPQKYNIILQSHNQNDLITAKLGGYRTTLLFIGAPLAVLKERSRQRAITTGKFLAPTLKVQDTVVENMWSHYGVTAPWYGLWADEFLIADNRRNDNGQHAVKHCVRLVMHSKSDWFSLIKTAEKAIADSYAE